MNNARIKVFIGITILSAFNLLSARTPSNIFLKNASAFDIVYKPLPAENELYQYGKTTPHTYEENVIGAGSGKMLSVGVYRNPFRLSIKRHGYGSGLVSSWIDVPAPEDLAREQLTADQLKDYEDAINKDKLPIITIKSSYLGGWSFSIGYTK